MCTKTRSRLVSPLLLLVFLLPAWGAGTLTYSGDSATTVFAEGSERAVLTGHARVVTEDSVITADRIELYGKDFPYATCVGNVKVVNAKRGMELTSDQLFYNRQDKIARITGEAVMTDLKNELVVKGGFIEDRDNEKLTTIQIGVRILKKDLVCRSEFARYDRNNNSLELTGMPWVSKKGDEYRAARISVNLDTEEISLEGDVKGEMTSTQSGASASEQPAQTPTGEQTPEATPSIQRPGAAKPPSDTTKPSEGQGTSSAGTTSDTTNPTRAPTRPGGGTLGN